MSNQFRGTEEDLKQTISQLKKSLQEKQSNLEEYEKDFNCYPATATNLQPYLSDVPKDLTFKTDYGYERDTSTACAKWFKLYSKLQNTKDPKYQLGIGPGSIYNFTLASPNSP